MRLDFYLYATRTVNVFDTNITHNLGAMAREAGIYGELWTPEEVGVYKAADLITPLALAIHEMEKDPDRFKKHDAENGWGKYEHFLPWVKEVMEACIENPDAEVRASR